MQKVVINYSGDFKLKDEYVTNWRRLFPQINFYEFTGSEAPLALIKDAVAFIGNPTDEMLRAMPQLRWVQLHSAGANNYVNNDNLRSDVILTNSKGVFGVPGAEHSIALVMAFTRQLNLHVRQQMNMIWKTSNNSLEVEDSTVVILGFGDIGATTAKKIAALGANVIVVKRSMSGKPDYVKELYTMEALDDALKKADFIINTLPLTSETKGIISSERISVMKKGAVFINVGRGQTVDERALIDALKSGHLLGAGLDVAETEPLPKGSPLWSLENVIITSHSVNDSPKKMERREAIIRENIKKFISGEPLNNIVNRNLGY